MNPDNYPYMVFTRVIRSAVMAASLALLLAACSDKTETPEHETIRSVYAIQIVSKDDLMGRSFPGRAKAVNEVNLAFNVGGTLTELPIQVGTTVEKNQLIARLDPREFESKLALAQAEANRDEKNFLRAKELVGGGHISKSDFDIVQAKWLISKASRDIAEKALSDTVIQAPFKGVISNLPVQNFQTVSANQSVTRLLDISSIEMIIQVPETVINLVPYAKNIQVKFDPIPNRLFPPVIKEISSEASSDTRTYPVTLTIPQTPDMAILPGMAGSATGKVEYPDKALSNMITLPRTALFSNEENNKSFVWVIDPASKAVKQREVSVAQLTPTGVSITHGIAFGEWVVTAGVHSLSEGQLVNIMNQPGV